MSDYMRVKAGSGASDRTIGLELPYYEQDVDDNGHATASEQWQPVTFASPAMLPRDVRRMVISIINGAAFDPEEFLLAATADRDNRQALGDYLNRDGIPFEALTEACTELSEAYAGGRGKAKPRR